MWNRNISWNKWQIRSTVDVDRISVDQSYSALLPELRRGDYDETRKLDLKRLIFYAPVPSMRNDDFFYMMAKVNAKDETAWVVAVDMERAAVEEMAPFSLGRYHYHIAMVCPCDFPKYLNMTPDMADNPVDKCFKRLSAKHCVVQVMWTLDRLRELDQCLEIERSTYNTCRLWGCLDMAKHACYDGEGEGEAASEALYFCFRYMLRGNQALACDINLALYPTITSLFPRALEDFDLALHESPSDHSSASIEAMRSKISDVTQALDNILQIVPSTLMPKERMLGDTGDKKGEKTIYKTCEKPSHEGAVVSGRHWLLSLIGCLLISMIVIMSRMDVWKCL